jgi:hypothetical protein
MYELRNWFLREVEDGMVLGEGNCYGNARFWAGQHIHTSPVKRIVPDMEGKKIDLYTSSGSCYRLDLAYLNMKHTELTWEALGVLGISLDLEECLALGKKREEEEQRRILEMLEPQELYVEMLGGMGVGKAFFKPQEAVLEEAQVIVHTGMYMDSILVVVEGKCDWRFFPSAFQAECYHWPQELKAVRLENFGDAFVLSKDGREIQCGQGEVTVVRREDLTGEGLVYPEGANASPE